MAEKYRVGIIGCGGISRAHARGFGEIESVKVVAGADTNKEALERFSEEFHISGKYTDYREMLDKENLNIVSVCTWQGTHAEITIAAAERGVRGILCEKPMCLNLREADAMIEACEREGARLAIGHHHRFNPRNTQARKLVREGAIGQPTLVLGRSADGLLNNGTHIIDRIRYVLGDPEAEWVIGQVERKTDRYERGTIIEDLCMGLVCFAGGTRVVIESDLPASDAPEGCFIYGTEGIIHVDRDALRLQNSKKAGWDEMTVLGDVSQFGEMISWIDGVSGHRSEARQARCTMEIMMAIYESARTRGLVDLPLQTKESPLMMMVEDGSLPVLKPGRYDIRAPK